MLSVRPSKLACKGCFARCWSRLCFGQRCQSETTLTVSICWVQFWLDARWSKFAQLKIEDTPSYQFSDQCFCAYSVVSGRSVQKLMSGIGAMLELTQLKHWFEGELTNRIGFEYRQFVVALFLKKNRRHLQRKFFHMRTSILFSYFGALTFHLTQALATPC